MGKSNTRTIPGYEGYEADTNGHIWSCASNWRGYGRRQLTERFNSYGYYAVCVMVDGRRKNKPVHVLVALAFHGLPELNQQVRHLDGDKLNNQPSNLAWGTAKDNAADRDRHGRTATGDRNGARIYRERLSAAALKKYAEKPHLVSRGEQANSAKLTEVEVKEIRREAAMGYGAAEIARNRGLDLSNTCLIIKRKTWRHVD